MRVRIFSSGSGRVVLIKLLACGARSLGSNPGLTTSISDIGHLLLPNRGMAERLLKRRKILQTCQPSNLFAILLLRISVKTL